MTQRSELGAVCNSTAPFIWEGIVKLPYKPKAVREKTRPPFESGRWDWKLEGTLCPTCHGTNSYLMSGDLHRSAGWVPCPRRTFQGHGFPTCTNGVLRFSEYDRKYEVRLRRQQMRAGEK